jgi:hypothetical protein
MPTRDEADLTIETLRACVDYDPLTGVLTWKTRPREHFNSDRSHWQRNGLAGKAIENRTDSGYVRVRIKIKDRVFSLRGHRVGWALTHGSWPIDEIDHVNRRRDDNRLDNLRSATHAEQAQNAAGKSRSGFPLGVRRHGERFQALIMVDGVQTTLGTFATPELAHAAYLEAKARLHPFQPEHPA